MNSSRYEQKEVDQKKLPPVLNVQSLGRYERDIGTTVATNMGKTEVRIFDNGVMSHDDIYLQEKKLVGAKMVSEHLYIAYGQSGKHGWVEIKNGNSHFNLKSVEDVFWNKLLFRTEVPNDINNYDLHFSPDTNIFVALDKFSKTGQMIDITTKNKHEFKLAEYPGKIIFSALSQDGTSLFYQTDNFNVFKLNLRNNVTQSLVKPNLAAQLENDYQLLRKFPDRDDVFVVINGLRNTLAFVNFTADQKVDFVTLAPGIYFKKVRTLKDGVINYQVETYLNKIFKEKYALAMHLIDHPDMPAEIFEAMEKPFGKIKILNLSKPAIAEAHQPAFHVVDDHSWYSIWKSIKKTVHHAKPVAAEVAEVAESVASASYQSGSRAKSV